MSPPGEFYDQDLTGELRARRRAAAERARRAADEADQAPSSAAPAWPPVPDLSGTAPDRSAEERAEAAPAPPSPPSGPSRAREGVRITREAPAPGPPGDAGQARRRPKVIGIEELTSGPAPSQRPQSPPGERSVGPLDPENRAARPRQADEQPRRRTPPPAPGPAPRRQTPARDNPPPRDDPLARDNPPARDDPPARARIGPPAPPTAPPDDRPSPPSTGTGPPGAPRPGTSPRRPPRPAPAGPEAGPDRPARRSGPRPPSAPEGPARSEPRPPPPAFSPSAEVEPGAEERPPGRPQERSSLGRSSALIATGTLLSRLTGFARVIAVLAVLGVSGVDDAYNFANAIPNIVFDLLLGGILSASLVPVFVDQLSDPDRDEGDRGISAIFTAVGLALAVITVILVVAAPLVIHFYLLLKGTSAAAGDERAVGTSLLHLFAPQVFFLGGSVVTAALLNARRQFGSAAFSPAVNNLIQIAAIGVVDAVAHSTNVVVFRHDTRAIAVLGIGITLGYVVELLIQVPALIRTGVRFRPVLDFSHPAVRRVIGLSGWLVGVVIANQISLNVILVFAGKRTGDATAYQNAYQFFQLPYALFTVSVASALTPDLADRWRQRDRLGFARRMIGGLRVTLAFLAPAAVGYALLAQPLIDVAVRHGQVHASGANTLSSALLGFVVGLPGFSAFVLLMRAYQAMQDTRTMFKMYAVENLMSLAATYPLYHALGVEGLALAWSIPYTIIAVVAAIGLRGRIGSLGGALTIRALWRIAVVSAVMGVVLVGLISILPPGGGDGGLVGRLIVEIGVGTGVYLIGARLLGIEEIEPVMALVRRLVRR